MHHSEDEMYYVLEWEYELRCDDRLFNAAKGALVSLPKEILHDFKNTGNALGKTLLILVLGGMEKVFEEINMLTREPPDLENINAITKKYGVEFLQP